MTGSTNSKQIGGSSKKSLNDCCWRSIAPSRVPAALAGAEHLVSRGPVHHHCLALVRAAVDRLWCGGGPRHPLLRPPRRRHRGDPRASAGSLPAAAGDGLRQPGPSGTHRGDSHALRPGIVAALARLRAGVAGRSALAHSMRQPIAGSASARCSACATCPRSRSSRWCSSSPTARWRRAVYSVQTLHANADGYGLLWTGFGAGAFAGVLTLTKLSRRWRPSIALPMIAVLWGALLCPLFFIRQLPLAMLVLGVAGASWAPYTPMETTLLQRLVPAEIRGQVFGARHSLVVAAAPLGAAFGGVLLQYLSAPRVIAISGLACILAGLGGLVSPSLRQLQRGSS